MRIAWGTSKLLWMYLHNTGDTAWDYVIDDFSELSHYEGIPVRRSGFLAQESLAGCQVYIFAVSNGSVQAILARLAEFGMMLGERVHLYSELMSGHFKDLLKSHLGWTADETLLNYATSITVNSKKLIHTTLCGNWLFLEAVHHLHHLAGDIAEVGCFEGGNALMCLQSRLWQGDRRYLLFDSFEGFPPLAPEDPATSAAGDYAPAKLYGEIVAAFAPFTGVEIIKGFVPDTFRAVPDDRRFSIVFFDCDLYQPALDIFAFFWNRIEKGGILLVHDYLTEPGGFTGVAKAVHQFFDPLGIKVLPFWPTTMAAVVKT